MSEPEPERPRKKASATGGQRLADLNAAGSPHQVRSVLVETPLARFIRRQSQREKVLTV